MTNLDSIFKSRDITLWTKVHLVKAMVLPVVIYGRENWCFWIVVLEETLESPLDSKEIQPVHSKGDQSWVFTGRTDVEAETPILWPPDAKSWLIGKDPDAGKDWGQEEKRATEDEMAGWHHWLNGRESGWTPGVGDGQGGLACCVHGVTKSQTWLSNWTELNPYIRTFKLWTFEEANVLLHVQSRKVWVKLQLALHLLLLTTPQLYHLPPPLSPPVFLLLLACSLDASPCMSAVVLYYCTFQDTVRLKMFYSLCLLFMYHLCE